MKRCYQFGVGDKVLQKTPYSFDVSVWEVLLPLMSGAELVFAKPEGHKDPAYLTALITEKRITRLHFVPSMLKAFLHYYVSSNQKPLADNQKPLADKKSLAATESTANTRLALTLTDIFCSGEALPPSLAKQCKHLFPDVRLHNLYGPTEMAIDVTAFNDIQGNERLIPIGRPIDNICCYVLDASLHPVPVGVAGELYLQGVMPSLGYLNKPELSAKTFINNPFSTAPEFNQLYKTGDRVRWLADGQLSYLGRNDDQVKLHGFRIELAEIEQVLSQHPDIEQAVVLLKEREGEQASGAMLVAYVQGTASESEDVIDQGLVHYLRQRLPAYMVPHHFIHLAQIPVTAHGKVNRKALPEPDFASLTAYRAAQSPDQERLCEIWQDILGVARVGIDDDFFALGGDSIMSIRLVSALSQQGLEVSVQDIVQSRTIAALSRQLSRVERIDSISNDYQPFANVSVDKRASITEQIQSRFDAELEDLYPASYLQLGMLIESQRQGQGTYQDVFSYRIQADFDLQRLLQSLASIVEVQPLLRSAFLPDHEQRFLIAQFTDIDLRAKVLILDERQAHAFAQHALPAIAQQPFPVDEPGLFRLLISDCRPGNFRLTIGFHHAIMDGWSVAQLIEQLASVFQSADNEQDTGKLIDQRTAATLPSYGRFVEQEQQAVGDVELQQFWRGYLAHFSATSGPLLVRPHSDDHSQQQALQTVELLEESLSFNADASKQLLSLARYYQSSPDNLFLSVYQQLLATFFNRRDICLGLVVNNRLEEEGGDKLLGLHLNTVPLRQSIGEQSIDQHLRATLHNKETVLAHKRYPFACIKADFARAQDEAGELYQCAFNYVHYHGLESLMANQHLRIERIFERTSIPFSLSVVRRQGRFQCKFKALTTFTDQPMLAQMGRYFQDYIEQLLSASRVPQSGAINGVKYQRLQQLAFRPMPNADRHTLLSEWSSAPAVTSDSPRHYLQLFVEVCRQYPEAPALVTATGQMTYRELEQEVETLARRIVACFDCAEKNPMASVAPNTPLVALYMERSERAMIGLLAIMRAGAAYVPLDVALPPQRLAYILGDIGFPPVLTNGQSIDSLNQLINDHLPQIPPVIDLDTYGEHTKTVKLPQIAEQGVRQTAYVIYTSGTTGQPKGTIVRHAALYNLIRNQQHLLNLGSDSVVLQYATLLFDASVWEIFATLASGACLAVMAEDRKKQPQALLDFMAAQHVTDAVLPPALLEVLPVAQLPKLQTLLTAGDRCQATVMQQWSKVCQVVNAYGPTENTVWSTFHNYQPGDNPNLIGKPLGNTQVFVLNEALEPLPVGVVGELFLGGASLADGYWGKPDVTAERFITHPFPSMKTASKEGLSPRLYRTGDLVCWTPEGDLEFVGRRDFQVKIRGFRVELAEIEQCLLRLDRLSQCAVIEKKSTAAQTYLIAYYVSEAPLPAAQLIEHIKHYLPDYMVPDAFVHLDNLPLTINGKVDRHGG